MRLLAFRKRCTNWVNVKKNTNCFGGEDMWEWKRREERFRTLLKKYTEGIEANT